MPRKRPHERVYEEAFAALVVRGEDLEPGEVTRQLWLPPTEFGKKGDVHLALRGDGTVRETRSPRSTGFWTFSSKGEVMSARLEVHVAWLLARIESCGAAFRELRGNGHEMRVWCFSSGRTDQPPTIPSDQHKRARELGLEIEIDHYGP